MTGLIQIEVTRRGSLWCLMTRTIAGLAPVGPRLERGAPLPVTQFEFTDVQEATKAAARLQDYLDDRRKNSP